MIYGPDGTFLGKLKAHADRDRGYFRRRLLRRLQALPGPTMTRALVTVLTPAATIGPVLEVADTRNAMAAAVSPQPISWLEWMTAGARRGARAARRRQWRFEITHGR
jgi:hypothetical protein